MKKVFLLLGLLFLPSCCLAVNITNSQIVSEMRVQVVEKGEINIFGNVNEVSLNLSIPQTDDYQNVESLEVFSSGLPCINSCKKSFLFDKYGNKILNIKWDNPKDNINFEVKLTVYVKRRRNVEIKKIPEFLMPTPLVQSTDEEIAAIASKARGNDFEKVSYLVKWINENIEYDKVYSNVNLSAKEILSKRRGVCDEISNLLVSFLRNLGYPSSVALGYVYPGKIYKGEKFQPHGWVEIYVGKGIIADPTWAEVGFLDATHIKFATFPDSNWVFYTIHAKGFGKFKAVLNDVETNIKILDFKEEPLVRESSKLLDEKLWEGYAVVKTDIFSNYCILTKVESKSCVDSSGKEFLKNLNPEEIVYFCDNKTIFSIFKLPSNLDPGKIYSCPLSVMPYAGKQEVLNFEISPRESKKVELFVDKTSVLPGEVIHAESKDSYIFTDFGFFAKERAEIKAPYYNFKIFAYNSGSLVWQNISVVLMKPFEVSLISNESAYIGETTPITIEVRNNLASPQTIKIKFKGKEITFNLSDVKNYTFYFSPQNRNDNLIQVFISSQDYSTSISKKIEILEKKSFLDKILEALFNFFSSIFSIFDKFKL